MSEKRFHQFGLWVIDNPNFNGISIADLVDTELMSITEVVDLLNEQQATIRKLQDLCGESDSENAKLRIENVQLQKENEQLKQGFNELLAVHTKVMQTLDDEFVSKALADDNGDGV